MLDFKSELGKLLRQEPAPLPDDGFAEIALAGKNALTSLNKKQSEISMQVEEIYDIVGGLDIQALVDTAQSEKRRVDALAEAVIGLCDMIEDFHVYAESCGDAELAEQGRMMWRNSGDLIGRHGFLRLDESRQPFDPELHTARAAEPSPLPREYVARVLRSGYRYMGSVIRRAAVTLSDGGDSADG